MLIMARRTNRRYGNINPLTDRFFDIMMIENFFLCVADAVAFGINGRNVRGGVFINHLSNSLYFELVTVLAYTWCIYANHLLHDEKPAPKGRRMFAAIPLILYNVFLLSNPFNGNQFTIDATNTYTRGNLVWLHWVFCWGYFIITAVQIVLRIRRENNRLRRRELTPMLFFIIGPTLGAVIQMFCFGITLIQVGVTISLLVIFLRRLENGVSIDDLTQLNNRRELEYFLDGQIKRKPYCNISILLMDVNRFKQINDSYGHGIGDQALIDVSDVLKGACGKMAGRVFLCRFGGDEFVAAGCDVSEEQLALLTSTIRSEFAEFNVNYKRQYKLEMSIGTASGTCSDLEDALLLLKNADESMYKDKKALKAER